MDADTLRLILFLAGVALILGIYLWDRRKKLDTKLHAVKREFEAMLEPEPELPVSDSSPRAEPSWESPEEDMDRLEEEEAAEPDPLDEALDDSSLDRELARLDGLLQENLSGDTPEVETEQQMPLSFSAAEPEPLGMDSKDVPQKILQINILARNGSFAGDDLMRVTRDVELEYGDMEIFHRYDGESRHGRVLFSMASMVEPGTLPLKKMKQFSTPGVILFAQLPGHKDGLMIFSDMLFTAERIAAQLDGELQDENHSDLSKQTIEHIREEILEHRRKVQLARSKR